MKAYTIVTRCTAIVEEEWVLNVPDDFDGDPAEAFFAYDSLISHESDTTLEEWDREVIDAREMRYA